jgi:hypothetical protein
MVISSPSSFNKSYSEAWGKLGLSQRRRPEEVFPRFQKKDFDTLKKDYNDKYGYVISIPKISDIIHVVPKELRTAADIKREKREALNRILASPSTDWSRKYTTLMTFLDDIQDTTSIIYPAISMLARWAPKVFGKLLAPVGWLMLGGDLLNLAIGILGMPMRGMGGKRLNCDVVKHNPFTKKARWDRTNRLRNYKPGISDLLQVAQTTDNVIGVGLSLGPILGMIMDSALGAYRYATGERVRFSMDVPDAFEHEKMGARAMKAAAFINTSGQTFSEENHFWSLVMGAVGGRIFLPYCYETDISASIENPMSIMIPAPYPKDPLTIEVIKEQGLDVNEGYGWPMNGKPEITMGDLVDYQVENANDAVTGYWRRHSHDWYGLISAMCWDQILPPSVAAFDPGSEMKVEDSEIARVCFTMLKAPLAPTRILDEKERADFFDWVMMISRFTGRPPGLIAIKEKFDAMRIPCRESYPATREPIADLFFPGDLDLSLYTGY